MPDFGHAVDDDAGVAAVFGGERVGLHLELLDHVDVRLERDLVLHHVAEVDAVDDVIGGVLARAGGIDARNADAAGRGQKRAVVGAGNDGAGLEQREIEKEAAVQRHLDDLLVFDHRAQAGTFGGHGGDLRLDRDHGVGFADLHHDVHAAPFVHREDNSGLGERLESLLL